MALLLGFSAATVLGWHACIMALFRGSCQTVHVRVPRGGRATRAMAGGSGVSKWTGRGRDDLVITMRTLLATSEGARRVAIQSTKASSVSSEPRGRKDREQRGSRGSFAVLTAITGQTGERRNRLEFLPE
jgi:hypothetical protein